MAEVALVLGDLVLGDEVVTERVPRQPGDRLVVLVFVVTAVGQDEIRLDIRRGALPSGGWAQKTN